jgi:hypothetical protein
MRVQSEPTQAIHLVIPGHPAAARAKSDTDGFVDTGETVAAEPLETAGDLTGPAVKGESRLMAQAQGRVDGTFTPSQTTARPAGLGLGRPAPAAWRKAAESVAARVAAEEEAEKPAKAAKPRATRAAKKPDAEGAAPARSTRTPKAKAEPESVTKPAPRKAAAKAASEAKPAARTTGSAAAKRAAAETRGSYQAEAAELLGAGGQRRRRRTAAEAEAAAEKPRRRGPSAS